VQPAQLLVAREVHVAEHNEAVLQEG
jgi:hypothetical protein